MAIYLNSNKSLELFKALYKSKYFVDKSMIIETLNEYIGTSDRYVCITRPRRFGKSSVTQMLGAYYSKDMNSKEIFDTLNIRKCGSYEGNLNKYNVISVSFNEISDNMKTYQDYVNNIIIELKKEVIELANKDNKIIALAFSYDEYVTKKFKENNDLAKINYCIIEMNTDGSNRKVITELKASRLDSISLSKPKDSIILGGTGMKDNEKGFYKLDLKSNKIDTLLTVYPNALYCYNLEDKELNEFFKIPDTFISNMSFTYK